MKYIELCDGKRAIVDDDFEINGKYRINAWGYVTRSKTIGRSRSTSVCIHIEILENMLGRKLSDSEFCDHKNRNKLDLRRENLRLSSKKQNNQNRDIQRNNTSGFRGVFWDKARSKWMALIGVDGKSLYLGRYKDKEDAAESYDRAAKELFGEFAVLNFPDK